jgi:hypothetical protein
LDVGHVGLGSIESLYGVMLSRTMITLQCKHKPPWPGTKAEKAPKIAESLNLKLIHLDR